MQAIVQKLKESSVYLVAAIVEPNLRIGLLKLVFSGNKVCTIFNDNRMLGLHLVKNLPLNGPSEHFPP